MEKYGATQPNTVINSRWVFGSGSFFGTEELKQKRAQRTRENIENVCKGSQKVDRRCYQSNEIQCVEWDSQRSRLQAKRKLD